MIDDLQIAEYLIDYLRSTGIKIDFHCNLVPRRLVDAIRAWTIEAHHSGHRYELSGDYLYPLALELAQQVGVDWECP